MIKFNLYVSIQPSKFIQCKAFNLFKGIHIVSKLLKLLIVVLTCFGIKTVYAQMINNQDINKYSPLFNTVNSVSITDNGTITTIMNNPPNIMNAIHSTLNTTNNNEQITEENINKMDKVDVSDLNDTDKSEINKTDNSITNTLFEKISDTSKSTLNAATKVTNTVLNTTQSLISNALGLLGVPYRYGGNTVAQGLDCSGFVKLVFSKTLGIILPRRASDMGRLGKHVNKNDLEPGDLVFFNTMRRINSHVGIYIGDDKFVHSPSTGGHIRVDKLSTSYWKQRFEWGKRITH